jgi:pimeloyl-ACP methyl ester carboxylesterase
VTPPDQYFDAAGVPIRYVESGIGEPVVLVHSYTSDLEDQWMKSGVFQRLARNYRTIAFDVRGHGKSGKPHDAEAYGAQMAWDVVRLLDHLGQAKAHVGGYSMGAHVVAQLLVLSPERCSTTVLGGACGRRQWTDDDERQAQIEAAEMERGRLSSQILRLWPAGTPKPGPRELEKLSARYLVAGDHYALAAIRRANKAQVVTAEQLAAVHVPILGIVGGADPYLASFVELRQSMPQLQLVIIPNAPHATASSEPQFVEAIETFLRAHAA